VQRAAAALQVLQPWLTSAVRMPSTVATSYKFVAEMHPSTRSPFVTVQEDAYAPWTPPSGMMGGDPGAGPVLHASESRAAMRPPPPKLPA
jgi:hypothetical protein